jgi:perosamine synthetase
VSIPWWWNSIPDSSKKRAINAIDSNAFTMGNNVAELENALSSALEIPNVVLTNSGTSALTISLMMAGIGPGDEVIVPALTWIATAQAAKILGATIKLVDVDPNSKCISAKDFELAITEQTKAVIPVFFNGRSPDLRLIQNISDRFDIKVIEDRAKALGTSFNRKYTNSGQFSQCFSLGMISYVSIGYGGFLGLNESESASQARRIRDHGMLRQPENYVEMGSNFKVSDFSAALGIDQVALLGERIQHTLKLQETYKNTIDESKGISLEAFSEPGQDIATYIEAILSPSINSDEFVSFCRKNDVEVIKYHETLTKANYLLGRDCLNAEKIVRQLIALPSGPGTSLENAKHAATVINRILSEM